MRVLWFVLVVLGMTYVACATEIFVGPSGNDANAGTKEAPLASLRAARDAVRGMRAADGLLPEGGVTVWVSGGTYPMPESLRLTAEDGGEAGRPVVYRAVAGEEVRLVGGVTIPPEAFGPATDEAVLKRIDADARSSVVAADLKALGVTAYGEMPSQFSEPPVVPELFFNDQRMTLAQWPNEGWAEVANVIESGPAPWRNYTSDQPGTFEYSGDRPSRWLNAPAVWLHGYWCFDWRAETIKVANIDAEKHQITFVAPHCYGLGSGNPAPRRYQAVNLLEELDQAGEYYLDRTSGVLYFWPPAPVTDARIVLSTLTEPVLDLDGASHVTLQGLTIEACAGMAIRVHEGASCAVTGCVVRNTGHDGVVVDGGQQHRVDGCDIYDVGTSGLRIGGGDRKTLTPCAHEAVNNHIWRVSRRQRTHAYHVHLSGVGVRLAHNLLHDAPHQSIGLAGNDHVIEYNDIHHICQDSDDCGAFYMGRNPSERGSVIRYNYWHQIGSTFTHGSCAIYFDDGSGGQTVYGNVFHQAAGGSFGAVFVHGGHDNVVENNIFIDCKQAMRQVQWNDKRWFDYMAEDLWQTRLLQEVDITKPPYIDRYPDLAGFMTPSDKPRLNHANRNVVVNCGGFVQGNWTVADSLDLDRDPGFVDLATQNFQLRDDSFVYREIPAFEKIPFDQIGLQRDTAGVH